MWHQIPESGAGFWIRQEYQTQKQRSSTTTIFRQLQKSSGSYHQKDIFSAFGNLKTAAVPKVLETSFCKIWLTRISRLVQIVPSVRRHFYKINPYGKQFCKIFAMIKKELVKTNLGHLKNTQTLRYFSGYDEKPEWSSLKSFPADLTALELIVPKLDLSMSEAISRFSGSLVKLNLVVDDKSEICVPEMKVLKKLMVSSRKITILKVLGIWVGEKFGQLFQI